MKILIAEDDRISRRLLQALLAKWGYEVVATCDGQEAWQVLQGEDTPQLAILDWMMPGLDGVEICRKVRQRKESPYVYLILLTARDRQEDVIAGLEAGADDYLTKPFDAHELKVRLRAGRRIIDLQAALLAAQESLRLQATHDPLTGLWNRAMILDILNRELSRSRREGSAVGVIMADLDHFKQINDTHGHLAGDAVLRETARRMKAAVRAYDEIGRYGGEEFLLILPGCDLQRALIPAERLRAGIAQEVMDTSEGLVPVTISLGVTSTSEEPEAMPTALIRAADAALYRAKAGGRNRTELARKEDFAGEPTHDLA